MYITWQECVTRWQENHIHLFEEVTGANLLEEGKLCTGAELDKVLQNYTVIEDIPCLHFVDELKEYYPDAKVILTTRDISSWQKSVEKSIFAITKMRILPSMCAIDPLLWRPYFFLLKSSVDKWTDGNISNMEAPRRTYIDYYAYVHSKVPSERPLNFYPRDG